MELLCKKGGGKIFLFTSADPRVCALVDKSKRTKSECTVVPFQLWEKSQKGAIMARQFTCVVSSCLRTFNSNERFVLSTNGRCPTCVKKEGVPRKCTSCLNKFVWHEDFARVVGHPDRPQMLCPTCVDKMAKMVNLDQPVIVDRKALQVFPLVRIEINMERAEVHDPQGKAKEGRKPARRLIVKDRHGKSYDGRLDIYDYREDGQRGPGSVARLRIMRATHQEPQRLKVMSGTPMGPKHEETLTFEPTYEYLVLEPVRGDLAQSEPPMTLVAAGYSGKSALKGGKDASGGLVKNLAHWSQQLTSFSRTGAHWGGTVIAIVDNEHPVLMRQDNNVWRYGGTECTLEEPGFRENGVARLTLVIPMADAELVERLNSEGFKSKLVGTSAYVRLKRQENVEGFILPDNLPTHEIRVESVESGGGYTNTGWSQIVASLDGSPLKPYATAGHRGDLACGEHGWFSVTGGLATVQAVRWTKNTPSVSVELATHKVVQIGNTVQFVSETLYRGATADLPEVLAQFRSAVEAASEKARDYHCRDLHFAQ